MASMVLFEHLPFWFSFGSLTSCVLTDTHSHAYHPSRACGVKPVVTHVIFICLVARLYSSVVTDNAVSED